MASGKYGAVSGMISRMQMMESISEQLASVQVRAYKKGTPTFESKLAEANSGMATKATNYVKTSGENIDFSAGALEFTGDPLHVALNGDGFFQVQRADGSVGYTRKGLFEINGDGILTDTNGQPVLTSDGGEIALTNPDVEITPDGNIWSQGEEIGQIAVYQFEDNSILRRDQGSMFVPADGQQPDLHPNPQVSQSNLEGSNVDVMRSMAQMTSNLRAFEAMQKALRIYSDMGKNGAQLGLVQ